MRIFQAVVLGIWSLLVASSNANNTTNGTDGMDGNVTNVPPPPTHYTPSTVPQCAYTCVATVGLSFGQYFFDHRMEICGNNTLQFSLNNCIYKECSEADRIEIPIIFQALCAGTAFGTRSNILTVTGLIFGPLAILAVLSRCYSRLSINRTLKGDDKVIIAAACLIFSLMVLYIFGIRNGFGRHFWDVNPSLLAPLEKIFWVSEILYILTITAIKLSILLFYRRVFPSDTFRMVNNVVTTSVVGLGFAVNLVLIFQCKPINTVWDRSTEGTCVDITALTIATAGISVFQDLVILVMPIPQLLFLNMSMKKKLNLLIMFSLGVLGCITSMVRLKYVVAYRSTTDPTYDNVLKAAWSFIEICVATICACLPAMRALLSLFFPSLFDLSEPPLPPASKKSSSPSPGGSSQLFVSVSSHRASSYNPIGSGGSPTKEHANGVGEVGVPLGPLKAKSSPSSKIWAEEADVEAAIRANHTPPLSMNEKEASDAKEKAKEASFDLEAAIRANHTRRLSKDGDIWGSGAVGEDKKAKSKVRTRKHSTR